MSLFDVLSKDLHRQMTPSFDVQYSMYVCMYGHVCLYVWLCMYAFVYLCVYVCIFVCMYV